MNDTRFIEVARPSHAEGIGRALKQAYRDGHALPEDIRSCLSRLDRI